MCNKWFRFFGVLGVLVSMLANAEEQAMKASWKTIQLPKSSEFRGAASSGKTFWVAGSNGVIYRSDDSGKHWIDCSLQNFPNANLRDVEIISENRVLVMSVGNGKESQIFETTDNGLTWTPIFVNTDEKGFFNAMSFFDSKNGLLFGDPVDGYFVVKKTTDGGRHWKRIDSTKLPKKHEKEIAFAASGNTLKVTKEGKAFFVTGGFSSSIYTSTDYGETWTKTSLKLHAETETSGAYGVGFNQTGEVFVIGGDYKNRAGQYLNLVADFDGWNASPKLSSGLRTAMDCTSLYCVATGKLGSDISYDQGRHWQSLSNVGFYTLTSNNEVIVGAGDSGRIGLLHLN